MKEIKINSVWNLVIPENFVPESLPFFNEWITALESGQYPQGRGALFAGEKYCCLGVLSKIQGRLRGRGRKFVDHSIVYQILQSGNPCYQQLGGKGEFPPGCKLLGNGRICSELTSCNDSARLTFEEIALVIRTLWKA